MQPLIWQIDDGAYLNILSADGFPFFYGKERKQRSQQGCFLPPVALPRANFLIRKLIKNF